jgi:hypothetical protein
MKAPTMVVTPSKDPSPPSLVPKSNTGTLLSSPQPVTVNINALTAATNSSISAKPFADITASALKGTAGGAARVSVDDDEAVYQFDDEYVRLYVMIVCMCVIVFINICVY